MNDWLHGRLYEYWDQRVNGIAEAAERLRSLSEESREQAIHDLKDAVLQHCATLSSRHMLQQAVAMAEDLYKAASVDQILDDAMTDYLGVTAGTFGQVLAERDFDIRYVIANLYDPTEYGLERPLLWFPIWFNAAGLLYICPQHIAKRLMEGDGIEGLADVVEALPRYMAEARELANRILDKAQAQRAHYVFLDTDSGASFDRAGKSSPNSVIILREELPDPGSKVQIIYPDGIDD
jgi:hypothetical protein